MRRSLTADGRASTAARIAAAGALAGVTVLVALVILGNGPGYTLRANFLDAGGLVAGNNVLIGPAKVGSVKSIGLTSNGQAQVVLGIDGGVPAMHEGTIARIYQNSLSGIANKYVVLEPGRSSAAAIPDGGVITSDHTYSEVSLDQLFDAFDPLTRAGLEGVIQGQAAAIQGRGLDANRMLQYLAPGLASTSDVTAELTRDEPAFDGLVVEAAEAFGALAAKSAQLTALVANTNATTGAIARQSQALQQALVLLPPTLTHSTQTFAGLRSTLDALDPLVAAAKPAVRQLTPFAASLRTLIDVGTPTIGALSALVHNPAGTGDLTTLALLTPALAKVAAQAFPRLIAAMNDSQPQLDYLREYTPDVVAALGNLGAASAYYDANGHYVRAQPAFNAFAVNSANQLTPKFPSQRYQGLQNVHGRCPGGAIQPTPDRSSPVAVPGCNPATAPPGP
jgi:phospholipid/cholesterol/gamma-HCH transport system substrate-binding protein